MAAARFTCLLLAMCGATVPASGLTTGAPCKNDQLVLRRASEVSAHACYCIRTGLLACLPVWACLRCTSAVSFRACCCIKAYLPLPADGGCKCHAVQPRWSVEKAACTPACCCGGARAVAARTGGAQVISCVVAIELVARTACPRGALRPRQEPQSVGCTGCCPAVRLLWLLKRKMRVEVVVVEEEEEEEEG